MKGPLLYPLMFLDIDRNTEALLGKLRTVGRATIEAQVGKLREEVEEVAEAPSIEELADVVIVATTAAAILGYDFRDLLVEVARKTERNAKRVWASRPDGTAHHEGEDR